MSQFRRPSLSRPHALVLGAASLALLATALPAQIWSEEFNGAAGAPDPAVWSYDLGAGGWGNNELQTYTSNPNNVQVQGGNLVITARQQGNGFTSARIRSQNKLTFQYGTIEARIQIPDLQDGLWPAFWTLGNSFGTVGWPDCGEIDVLEMGASGAIANNQVNRRAYSTAHWEFNNGHAFYGLSRLSPVDLDGSFHIWRLEWTPTAISTFIDGQWIWTIDISNPASFDGQEFHAPHFFVVNLAVGGDFPGIHNRGGITAPLPAEYRVDYIRIFDNGHTILGGSSRTVLATSTRRTGAGNFNSSYVCSPPVIGSSMRAHITGVGLAYQFGGVLGYLSDANMPFGNYTLLIDLSSSPVFVLPLTAFQVSTAVWNLPIPNDQAMAGIGIKTQGVLFGSDLAFTNAMDLQLGN